MGIRIGFYIRIGWDPRPVTERIILKNAPRFMRGLKLMFASDLHFRDRTSDSHIGMIADMLGAHNADMLLLGGDYGESSGAAIRFFDLLSEKHFPMGMIGVPGNNDIEAFGNKKSLISAFPGRLLVNESVTFRRRSGKLVIGGYDELKYGDHPIHSLFSGAADCYNLLVSHYPLLPSPASGPRPRLMLSGHTHGGQIRFMGITAYSLGMEKEIVSFIEGEKDIGGTKLIVSPGIGVSRLPIRLNCRPKIHLIEFA